MRRHLSALLGDGIAELVLDLSGVSGCGPELFAVLADTDAAARARDGWLHLVGLPPPVLDALSEATLPEVVLVYRVSGWTRTTRAAAADAASCRTITGETGSRRRIRLNGTTWPGGRSGRGAPGAAVSAAGRVGQGAARPGRSGGIGRVSGRPGPGGGRGEGVRHGAVQRQHLVEA